MRRATEALVRHTRRSRLRARSGETCDEPQHQSPGRARKVTAMAGEALHEERSELSPEILDRHRAISTIMEEMEAIAWYDQRIEASTDAELQAVLAHNRGEEKEHAAMLLEWLRRHDAELETHLRNSLFSTGPIREKPAETAAPDGSLGIGSLRR